MVKRRGNGCVFAVLSSPDGTCSHSSQYGLSNSTFEGFLPELCSGDRGRGFDPGQPENLPRLPWCGQVESGPKQRAKESFSDLGLDAHQEIRGSSYRDSDNHSVAWTENRLHRLVQWYSILAGLDRLNDCQPHSCLVRCLGTGLDSGSLNTLLGAVKTAPLRF